MVATCRPEARAVRYLVTSVDALAIEAERMTREGTRDERQEGAARLALLKRIQAMLLRQAHKSTEGASPDDHDSRTQTGPADAG